MNSQAMKSADNQSWHQATQDEYRSLIENNTWTLVDLPPGRRAIDGKWIFHRKYALDGNVDRFKARSFVRGFKQQPDVDYIEHEFFEILSCQSSDN